MRIASGFSAVVAVSLVFCVPASAEPEVGIVQVYGSVDEAAGYVGCADDLAEAAAAGITRVAHFPPERARFGGLDEWLKGHADHAARYEAAKAACPGDEDLAFHLFFWQSYLADVAQAGKGKMKVLVGPLWPTFVDPKAGPQAERIQRFVAELSAFEKVHAPESVAGWVMAVEPLSPAAKQDVAHARPLVDAIRAGETVAAMPPRPVWVWESTSRPPKELGAFLAVADDLLILRDTWLWHVEPAARVPEAAWGSVPSAVRTAREIAHLVKNDKLRVHVALQAFDWAEDDAIQPSHLDMHQQLRMALSGGLADRGSYGAKPSWVEPPASVWLYWWADCKGERKADPAYTLNRWDDPKGAEWREAIQAEIAGEPGAIHVTRDETWFGSLTLVGDVIVHKGATLTIEVGSTIAVAPVDLYQGGKDKKHVEIVIFGTLVVKGNEQRKVSFRCDTQSPTLNAKPRKASKGDWYGFRVEKGGAVEKNKFTYVSDALDSK